MSRLLILGATGFIGGHVLQHAIERGFVVRVLINNDGGTLRRIYPSVEIFIGGLNVPQDLERALVGVHTVVHAASKNIDADGFGFDQANVKSTEQLAYAARKARVAKIIYISSVGIYGHNIYRDANEATPIAPDTAFSRSKAAAEAVLLEHHYAETFRVVVLRHRFVYGNEDRHLVPRAMSAIRRYPFFIDHGHARTSFISAHDFAKVTCRFAENVDGDFTSPIYHVTDGMPLSHFEFVDTLCKAFSLPMPRHSLPFHLLYRPTRLCEKILKIDPEATRYPLSSIRLKMLGRDSYFSNGKLMRLMPDFKFRSFIEGIDEYGAYYRHFA